MENVKVNIGRDFSRRELRAEVQTAFLDRNVIKVDIVPDQMETPVDQDGNELPPRRIPAYVEVFSGDPISVGELAAVINAHSPSQPDSARIAELQKRSSKNLLAAIEALEVRVEALENA